MYYLTPSVALVPTSNKFYNFNVLAFFNSLNYSFICYSYLISENAMAPHCSTLAWKIPWTEEPGRVQSMGSQRVGYDVATKQQLV